MTRYFIIIEPDPVVCMDIEGMLIAAYPGCHVTTGTSLAEVGAAIHNCGAKSTFFIKGMLLYENSDLHRVIRTAATRGSQIVVMGEFADLGIPAKFVAVPFTTDMIISAVECDKPEGQIDLVM